MTGQPLKLLANVFICVGENRLQLVDIYFNSHIERIEPCLDSVLDWDEISDKESWESFKQEIPEQKFPPQFKVYDGKFMLLMPGAIDAHVHFNTPGFEFRETIETGSLAAAFGGVTTIIDMPCTSIPPVTSLKNLKIKKQSLRGRSKVDYALWGGVAGNDFQSHQDVKKEIEELSEAGVVGFKAYLISGMETFSDLSFEEMVQAAKWIKRAGKILAVHAEDKLYIAFKRRRYQEMWWQNWRAYCDARDDIAEAKSVALMINIARKTGSKIHIVHLSSELGLELIRKARLEGLDVSCETCPHFLQFTQHDFENTEISNFLKTAPPVKNSNDREALWEGLRDGTISFVTTDHAGCDPIKEKSAWNFWEVYGGIPGVEIRVPYLFSEGFLKGRLSLTKTIDLLSTEPAEFFGLNYQKGSIAVGKDADFALINLWSSHELKGANLHCKGKYSPFEGMKFNADVKATFLRGKKIMDSDNEEQVEIAIGEYLESKKS